MELWAGEFSAKLVWILIRYVGVVFTPVFWLVFVLQYVEKSHWVKKRYFLLLSVVPLLTLGLIGTSYLHDWMFTDIRLVTYERMTVVVYNYGIFFWLHFGYSYFLFALGSWLLLEWMYKKQLLKWPQAISLVVGGLLPLAANFISTFGGAGLSYVDLTPLGLTLGVLAVGWALFGLKFMEINPVAREFLIEGIKDGVIVINDKQLIIDINPAAHFLIGGDATPRGRPISEVLGQEILELPVEAMYDTYPHQEIQLRDRNGVLRDIDVRASPLIDHNRMVRGWLILLRDITEQKRMRTELENKTRRLAAIAEIDLAINQPHELTGVLRQIVNTTADLLPASSGSTIYIWNEAKRSFESSESTLSPEQLDRLALHGWKEKVSAHWIAQHQQPIIVEDTRKTPNQENALLSQSGIMSYAGFPLIANGKLLGVMYADSSEPRKYTAEDLLFLNTLANRAARAILKVQQFTKVQEQATTDHVTGVNNRHQLYALGTLEFKRAWRFKRPLSAIMLDIDHFKQVNDLYGHAKGDEILRALAQFLLQHLREFDILGRYGGEEFAIVLPGADLANARAVARRLREGVEQHPMGADQLKITISLGVAEMGEDTPDFQAFLDKADQAMYDAKRAGRNCVAWKE